MSLRATSWVWNASQSTGADRLTLLALADFANDQGREAYPSVATLARMTGANERTVQRSIRALAALGELTVEENRGPKGVHKYRIHIPKGWRYATRGGDTPPGDTPPGVAGDHPADDHQGWQDAGGDISPGGDTPPGVTSRPSGGGDTPPNPPEILTSSGSNAREIRNDTDPRFAEFWSVYPLKVGKGAAMKALTTALKIADLDAIVGGAKRYRDNPRRNPDFTAHASTWLNQRRWEDELVAVAPPKTNGRPTGGYDAAWEAGM